MTDAPTEDRPRSAPGGGSAIRRWVWPIARGLIGVALFTLVLRRTDAGPAFGRFLGALWLVPVLLVLTAFGASIEAERLRLYFAAAGLRLAWRRAYVMVAVGTFFNFCIPGGTGGDMAKLFYLAKDNRQRGPEVAAAILVDRLVALSALLATVSVLALTHLDLLTKQPALLALAGVAAAGLAVLIGVALVAPGAWFAQSRLLAWMADRRGPIRHLAGLSHGISRFAAARGLLLAGLAVSLAGHLGLLTTYVLLTRVAFPATPVTTVALLAGMGMLVNAIPITPGGLGVGEAAFEQLFHMVGVTGGASLVLAWRISVLPLAAVGAILYSTGRLSVGAAPAPVPAPER